jgi:hypothetical protein
MKQLGSWQIKEFLRVFGRNPGYPACIQPFYPGDLFGKVLDERGLVSPASKTLGRKKRGISLKKNIFNLGM